MAGYVGTKAVLLSTTAATVGGSASVGAGLTVDNDGATVLTVDRATSNGTIIDLQKSGSSVGVVGVNGDRIYLTNAQEGIMIDQSANNLSPTSSTGTFNDNAMNLGESGNRWKDLWLSGGVYLGGTGSANKISDYETGTWTPTLAGLSTTGSPTYTTREGWYVKVGDMVTASCAIDLSALGGVAGDLRITNLPFNASATFSTNANVGTLRLNGVNSEPDGFCVIVIGGGSEVAMRSINANSDTNLLGNNLTNTTGFGFQVSYRTS